MKKIEIGHLVRVFHNDDTFEGVVVDIDNRMDNIFLKYVSVSIYDGVNKKACKVCIPSPNYQEGDLTISYLQDVEMKHVKVLQEAYKNYHEVPESIEPNKQYNNGLEVYVKTKKNWFKLIRTTAKMAFFEGGRCVLSNVTDIRRHS